MVLIQNHDIISSSFQAAAVFKKHRFFLFVSQLHGRLSSIAFKKGYYLEFWQEMME